MKKAVGIVLLLLAVAGGVRYWLSHDPDKPGNNASQDKPPAPVVISRARVEDVPLLLEVVGRAEAYESVTLKSRVDGQVAAVEYTEGRHVEQGQVLVRLDPGDFEAKLRQADANLARDRAQLAKARADVRRYVSLRKQDYVSDEKVGEVQAAAAATEAATLADQAAVDLARLQLSYSVIRAPFAGVVGARLVFPGTAVKVNETELAVVNRVQPLFVTFSVPEKYLAKLRTALRSGPITITTHMPGNAGHSFEGEARFLDNAVDTATSTIQMKAVLPNTDELLTPGQFLNVIIPLDVLRGVVTVPAEAVQQGPEGSFVYAVTADQVAEMRPVQVAATQHGRTAFAGGLREGEMVITEGHLRVSPGANVQPKQATGQTRSVE